MAPVEVLRQPPAASAAGDPVNRRHEEPADVVSHRHGQEEEGPGDAPHVLRELLVVELHLPDGGEGLGEPGEGLLRHQPEALHGGRCAGPTAPPLHQGGSHGGDDGEEEPCADPLEQRQPFLPPRPAAQPGHRHSVVEGQPEGDGEHGEDGEGRRRDDEGGAPEAAVRLECLKNGEGRLLDDADEEDGAGPPDGDYPY